VIRRQRPAPAGGDGVAPPRLTRGRKLVFALVVAVVTLGMVELGLRLSGLPPDTVAVGHAQVPAWMLADPGFVAELGSMASLPAQGIDLAAVFAFWGHFTPDPALHYRLRPNLSRATVNTFSELSLKRDIRWTLTSNARGYRGALRPYAKPAGVRRVVCLGDSSTYGWGVEADETYAVQLETMLSRSGERWEVINLGMPGYTSVQGALLIDEALSYEPDVVTVSFGSNDGTQQGLSESEVLAVNRSFATRLSRILEVSRLYRGVRHVVYRAHNPATAPGRHLVARVPAAEFESKLAVILDRVVSRGVLTVFVRITAKAPYDEALARVLAARATGLVDFSDLVRHHFDAVVAGREHPELARQVVATWGAVAVAASPELYLRVDPTHPGPIGHRLIAEALRAAILAPP